MRIPALALAALVLVAAPAQATDRTMGETFAIAATYCPEYSLPADGRLLKNDDYPELYHLLEYRFGGDGKTHFALPELQGGPREMTPANGPQLKWCIFVRAEYPQKPDEH